MRSTPPRAARLAPQPAGGLSVAGPAQRKAYTLADVRFVAQHYRDHTAAELARLLGRTPGALRHFIVRQGLRKQSRP